HNDWARKRTRAKSLYQLSRIPGLKIPSYQRSIQLTIQHINDCLSIQTLALKTGNGVLGKTVLYTSLDLYKTICKHSLNQGYRYNTWGTQTSDSPSTTSTICH
uniref:Uncharacterized protein n=1 Tax=Parascaris univalens TaxID=6257 RepID=A0A915C0P6_PARUN